MDNATAGFILGLVVGERRITAGLDWSDALTASLRYRLGGLAWRVAAADPGVPGLALDGWEAAHRTQAVAGGLLLDELEALRVALSRWGIRFGVVKGVQLLQSGVYSLGTRAVDDVDLVVSRNTARAAVEALVDGGWVPWSRTAPDETAWAPAAAFEARGPARLAGLSVDLHWDTDYGRLRSGERTGAAGPTFDAGGWPRPEDHLVLVLEHVLKHLRFRTHLVGLADAVRLARIVTDWSGLADALRRSPWSGAASALLEGLADETPDELIPPGVLPRARPPLRRRLDPFSLVAGADAPPGRLGGLRLRWSHLGLRRSVRDLVDVLAPPGDWLGSRYRREPNARRRIRHVGRVVRWGLGTMPSPLAPNGGDG